MEIQINISVGELIDKITILQIKKEKIADLEKVKKVSYELKLLENSLNSFKTSKTEELRDQYFEMSKDMTADDIRANMKNENASFQMNWNNEKNDMVMFCWWKANSPEAIEETLGEMGQMFVNDIKEMANVMDVTD